MTATGAQPAVAARTARCEVSVVFPEPPLGDTNAVACTVVTIWVSGSLVELNHYTKNHATKNRASHPDSV
jgi:hypothetical protein